MRVVLGVFNDMHAKDKNIVGPIECLQNMIEGYKQRSFQYKEDLNLSEDECFITSPPDNKREDETVDEFYQRIISLNRIDAYGHLSNFEIIEVKQDYLFNKLILLADYEDWQVRDTGFKLRALATPLNVEEMVYGDIKCTYRIENAIKDIIAFDVVSGPNPNEEISEDNPNIDIETKTYRTNGFDHLTADTPLLEEELRIAPTCDDLLSEDAVEPYSILDSDKNKSIAIAPEDI